MVADGEKAIGVAGIVGSKDPRREAAFEATVLDEIDRWCWGAACGGLDGRWSGLARVAGAS